MLSISSRRQSSEKRMMGRDIGGRGAGRDGRYMFGRF